MADFCSECSLKIFGRDCGDIRSPTEGILIEALCEGCGAFVTVDKIGNVISRAPFCPQEPTNG